MKKIIFAILTVLTVFAASAAFAETAHTVAGVTVNGETADNWKTEYPALEYGGTYYIPLSYYGSRFLGLVTDWDSETGLVTVRRLGVSCGWRQYYRPELNPPEVEVDIFKNDVALYTDSSDEGAVIKNSEQDPPLLVFRDITYIPLAEPYLSRLRLSYEDDGQGDLYIKSDNYHASLISMRLWNYGGGAAAYDGKYYYYQATDGNVYRAADGGKEAGWAPGEPQLVYTVPVDPLTGEAARVSFACENSRCRMDYILGGTEDGYEYSFIFGPDGTPVETEKRDSVQNRRAMAPDSEDYSGDAVIHYHRDPVTGELLKVSYSLNGCAGEFPADGVSYSDAKTSGYTLFIKGERDGVADLYQIDIATGEKTVVAEDIKGNFYVGYGLIGSEMKGYAFYCQDGREIMAAVDGDIRERRAAESIIEASMEDEVLVKTNGGGTVVTKYSGYFQGSLSQNVFVASEPFDYGILNGTVYGRRVGEAPGAIVNFALFGEGRPYFTADLVENPYYFRDPLNAVLLYSADGKLFRVNMNDPGGYNEPGGYNSLYYFRTNVTITD